MSASYIPYHPEQQQLLPSALQDWLPQGHLVYFINDTVDSLNLSGFHLRYAAGGPAPSAVSPGHDGQGFGLCIRYRHIQFTQDRQKAA
jgi:hypothetical protein